MYSPSPSLLFKFRDQDTRFGVTRDTVKKMAEQFGLSETEVIHVALSRLAKEELASYEEDDGPLTAQDLRSLRKLAKAGLPRGKLLSKQSLF